MTWSGSPLVDAPAGRIKDLEDEVEALVEAVTALKVEMSQMVGFLGIPNGEWTTEYRHRDTDGVMRRIDPLQALNLLGTGATVERRTTGTWRVVKFGS